MNNNISSDNLCMGCMEPTQSNSESCPHCGYIYDESEPISEGFIKPETIVYDRYLVGKALGADRFGIRYVAYDMALDCKVLLYCAIPKKQAAYFKGSMSDTLDQLLMLDTIKERSASLLNIPHLMTCTEAFVVDNELYTISKYTNGIPLSDYISRRGGKVSYRTAFNILKKAAGIVHKMHSRGIIHGGISPDSIYVDDNGTVSVMDRDYIAQKFADNPKIYLRSGYAAIEQYGTDRKPTMSTDVYAIASCLYYAITGKQLSSAVDRELGENCTAPSEMGIHMPGNTEKVMINALLLDSNQRIQTLDDLFIELRDADAVISRSEPIDEEDDEDDSTDTESRRKLPGYFKYIVLGVAAAVLIFVFLLVSGVFEPKVEYAPVPSVTNMTIDSAREKLEEAGFTMLIADAQADDKPAGIVISQSHTTSEQPIGDIITVTVSSGTTADGTVPNLVHEKLNEAFGSISALGLRIVISSQESNDVMVGNIISQSINAGATVDAGSEITLVVSAGSPSMTRALSKSKTVEAIPATVAFINESFLYFVGTTTDGLQLAAMPANPTYSDPESGLNFFGWYMAENGGGAEFTNQSVCTGFAMVYSYFSEGTPPPTIETTQSPEETTLEPSETPIETDSDMPTDSDVTNTPEVPTDEPVTTTEAPVTTAPPETVDIPTTTPPTTEPMPEPTPTPDPEPTFSIDDVTIEPSEMTVGVGASFTLTLKGAPSDARIEWHSSDGRILRHQGNGEFLAVSAGTVSVTVVVNGMHASAECIVTVFSPN